MNEKLVQFYLTGFEKNFFKAGYGITSEAYKTDWYIEMSCLEDSVYPEEFNRTKTDEWEKAKNLRRSQLIQRYKK